MGEPVLTKFWIGGDIERNIAEQLCGTIISAQIHTLKHYPDDEVWFAPTTANDLVANVIDGKLGLFDYQRNYGDIPELEAFCQNHGIPWEKWHAAGGCGEWGPSYYFWNSSMAEPLIFLTDGDEELLIPKSDIDSVIKVVRQTTINAPSGLLGKQWIVDLLSRLRHACPDVPVLPPFRVFDHGVDLLKQRQAKAISHIFKAAELVPNQADREDLLKLADRAGGELK